MTGARATLDAYSARRSATPCRLSPPLRPAWTLAAGGPAPEVSVLAHAGRVLLSMQDRLVAVDASSGRSLWSYPWHCRAEAVYQDAVLLWLSEVEAHLVDLASGRPRRVIWADAPSALRVVGRFLIGRGRGRASREERLTCTDLESGERRWAVGLGQDARNAKGLAASESLVVACRSDGQVVAVSVETGTTLWARSWPELGAHDRDYGEFAPVELRGQPALVKGRVILRVGQRLMAVSAQSGRTLWDVEGWFDDCYAGRLYAAASGRYLVRDAASGKVVREHELRLPRRLGDAAGYIGRPMLVCEAHVFVGGREGVGLFAFDRETGKYAWHQRMESARDLVVCDGRLVFTTGGSEPKAYCFEGAS